MVVIIYLHENSIPLTLMLGHGSFSCSSLTFASQSFDMWAQKIKQLPFYDILRESFNSLYLSSMWWVICPPSQSLVLSRYGCGLYSVSLALSSSSSPPSAGQCALSTLIQNYAKLWFWVRFVLEWLCRLKNCSSILHNDQCRNPRIIFCSFLLC